MTTYVKVLKTFFIPIGNNYTPIADLFHTEKADFKPKLKKKKKEVHLNFRFHFKESNLSLINLKISENTDSILVNDNNVNDNTDKVTYVSFMESHIDFDNKGWLKSL